MDPTLFWMLDYMRSPTAQRALQGLSGTDGLSERDAMLLGASGGDIATLAQMWGMRQTAPWLASQLTAGLKSLGLGAQAAGALGAIGAPLALMGLLQLFKRKARPTADTNWMLQTQRAATLQNAVNETMREATQTGAQMARAQMETARALAGGNQYLGQVLAQSAAPSAADAASKIVMQGLENRAALQMGALQHERQKELAALQYAQNLTLEKLREEQRRRAMLIQLLLAMNSDKGSAQS